MNAATPAATPATRCITNLPSASITKTAISPPPAPDYDATAKTKVRCSATVRLQAIKQIVAAKRREQVILLALANALTNKDEKTKSAAHAALKSLTTLDLPPDAIQWKEKIQAQK